MAQVQVKFVTTRKEYAVPSKAILVPVHFDPQALSETILMLLGKPDDAAGLMFDFLIDRTPLRGSLSAYLSAEGLSTENVLTLDYDLRFPPPVPTACHQTDDWVAAVAVLSDTCALSAGFDGVVRQWQLPTLSQTHTHQLHRLPLKCIAPFQHGTRTKVWVGGLNTTISELQINQDDPEDTFHVTRELVGHTGSIESLVHLPKENTLISASFDGTIHLHTLPTDEEDTPIVPATRDGAPPPKKKMRKHTKVPVAAEPVASGHTLQPTSQWTAHTGGVSCVAVQGATVLVSGGQDQALRTWDLATLSPLSSVAVKHVACVQATTTSPGGQGGAGVVSGHQDGVRWFDLRQHQPHAVAKTKLGWVRDLLVDGRDPYCVCAGDRGVHVVDRRSPVAPLHTLPTDLPQRWFGVDGCHGWVLAGGDQCQLELWKEAAPGVFVAEKHDPGSERTER